MPRITENGKTYWMPEVLPEPTKEHQATQKEKKYLTQEGVERMHPEWTYAENVANVDDEYLFQNEGWKLIIDDGGPVILDTDLKHKTRNEIVDWEEQEGGKTIKVTYTLVDFTEEEVAEYTEQKWERLRMMRDNLLRQTDWVIVRAMEENLVVSTEVTAYRQALRDFPETIENILEFNLEFRNNALWPIKPEVYFAV
jgi:hypothetical protein